MALLELLLGPAIGSALAGLLGRLFGRGGDIPGEIRMVIEGARDQILWYAVRYDKNQRIAPRNTTDDERGMARDNINALARWDLPEPPAPPNLSGFLR